ncbi:GntR family transcriptional regulator [Mycolicibacterium sp. 624]|uniref:GntR family transcriptional regulator n=1 Tax=Mycolicibacterium sp. 624 TaxID=3156314 RepID=UPI00339B3BBC
MSARTSTADTGGNDGAVADLAAEVRAAIGDGGLEPGTRIGAERELAARYGVTRWVVRKALEELESESLILRTHGRNGGVFVAPRKLVRDLDHLVGLPEYLRAQGLETGTTVLGTRVVRAEGEVAHELQVTDDAHLYEIERARFAAGLPLSVETVFVSAEMFPGLLDQSLVGSLYDLLESRYEIKRGMATETITAAAADARQAATLELPVGAPLLVVRRTALLESGEPFEHSLEYYRFDRMSITVHTSSPAHIKRQIL